MKSILIVFGTRPEAIKLAPVIKALRAARGLHVHVCITGQHREMLNSVLALFDIKPDYDLNVMRPGQDLTDITSSVLYELREILRVKRYDLLLVHGDTTTALSASLAAFYHRIPLAHVEAGLRTYDLGAPWPEEMNRRVVGLLAHHHFSPTDMARDALLAEGVPQERIVVTGNTVIDALQGVCERIKTDPNLEVQLAEKFSYLYPDRRLILVTGHRRENFGAGFEQICMALRALSQRPDVQIVYPVHLNPNVQYPVYETLSDLKNVFLIEPQDYVPFVYLMMRSFLILTDSGGVQEEAPSLGKPVLVMRETTERPEAVAAGTVKLVGSHHVRIIKEATHLLDDAFAYSEMARAHNPYGDGKAAQRICNTLCDSYAVTDSVAIA